MKHTLIIFKFYDIDMYTVCTEVANSYIQICNSAYTKEGPGVYISSVLKQANLTSNIKQKEY